ncbi:MAG: right-handed parallel beta-helix repeat-containing protein [Candidatus Thorarchaeota archaeon]
MSIVLTILFCSSGCSISLISNVTKSGIDFNPSQTYVSSPPMVITSNDDFATAGWTGDGSQGIPYMIEWLEFTSAIDGTCISISNTTAYFRIMNCSFNSSSLGNAIKLQNVINGQIHYSITGGNMYCILIVDSSEIELSYLTTLGTCISLEQSSQCSVSFCSIDSAPGDGIFLLDCSQIAVQGCEITNCAASGISLENTGETTVSDNVIQSNSLEQIYISGDSSINRFYNNEIHMGVERVIDNGNNNDWDNDVSIGNWWSDFDGPGFYYVPGSAGSVDHFPRGPSTPETTSTTSTTSNTSDGTGEIVVTNWTPMDLPMRVVLGLSIGLSYCALVVLAIKRFR